MLNGLQSLSQPATALANLALLTPATTFGYQPFDAITGAALGKSFLFTFEMENKVKLQSEYPDSFLETNTFIQDHAVNKPAMVTVRAKIGEVVLVNPPLFPVVAQIQSALQLVSSFAPAFSESATNVINQAAAAYQQASAAVNGAVQAWANLTGSSANIVTPGGELVSASQNQQQQMFSQIYGFWNQQTNQAAPCLWTIQSPWALWSPMGLVDAEITQGEDTETMSEFLLTFKQIRILNDTAVDRTLLGRAANLAAPTVNNGTVVPTDVGDVGGFLPGG